MTGIAAILHMEIPGLDDMVEGDDDGDIESGDEDTEFVIGSIEEQKSETQSEKGSDYEKKANEFFEGSDQASAGYENDLLDDIFGELENEDSEEGQMPTMTAK